MVERFVSASDQWSYLADDLSVDRIITLSYRKLACRSLAGRTGEGASEAANTVRSREKQNARACSSL